VAAAGEEAALGDEAGLVAAGATGAGAGAGGASSEESGEEKRQTEAAGKTRRVHGMAVGTWV
jgi:hypothetical protein